MRVDRTGWAVPALAGLAGAAALSAFSMVQKLLLGVPPELMVAPASFAVPVLFGGTAGTLLGAAFRRLRRSEERYRTVSEHAAEMVFWREPDGSLRYVSPSALAVTGWSAEELLAEPGLLERMVHPEDHAACLAHQAEPRLEADVQSLEFRIVRRDGALRWIAHVCRPVLGPRGERLGLRATHTDVTQRKHLEQQVQQAQRLEAVGQLAGGVAHDLRNVLTAVLGPAELIAEGSTDPASRAQAREILEAGQRAAALARDLLDLARREPLQLRPTTLQEVAGGAARLLERVAGPRQRLELRDGGVPLRVAADGRRLEQVLLNLVTNARDAMPDGGLIVLELDRAGPGEAVIRVRDAGCGMAPEVAARAFEPLFTTKAPGQGTGLGLAVVQHIVRDHHGTVAVDSAPGRGTTVEVRLPLLPEP